ncbi:hypothetical protein HPB49_003364 [Dermacentor silvarum]|uniref:Uncharacterized protein n=1 Tax=Dermacentor silvarum TaxID=543639 RepID=A0ACB8CDB0_DERSI|nr:hypothetical protein HPB49_003364 [Dermacentor silvarum]
MVPFNGYFGCPWCLIRGEHVEGAPSVAAKIESRLLAIKPPHCVTRLPRPLKDRGHWKASEWRHWILFYALPCLDGILHPEYWKHLSRLSEGIHILLQEELDARDIHRAGLPIMHFMLGTLESVLGMLRTILGTMEVILGMLGGRWVI